jgi:hypothetical protein
VESRRTQDRSSRWPEAAHGPLTRVGSEVRRRPMGGRVRQRQRIRPARGGPGVDLQPELRGAFHRPPGRPGRTDPVRQEFAKSPCRGDNRGRPASAGDHGLPGTSRASASRNGDGGHRFVEGEGFSHHQHSPQPVTHPCRSPWKVKQDPLTRSRPAFAGSSGGFCSSADFTWSLHSFSLPSCLRHNQLPPPADDGFGEWILVAEGSAWLIAFDHVEGDRGYDVGHELARLGQGNGY